MARILIADDHEGTRAILRVLLQDHGGWEICGEAGTNSEAIQKSMELKPDVLVKDWVMPGVSDLENKPGDREMSSGYCDRAVLLPRPP
jgi:two-component system capsular synthesis response regulator RcsB